MDFLHKYFPELSEKQFDQFEQLYPIYKEWNAKINVVSRKDIENLELHHFVHSLAMVKKVNFPDGSRILDVGTGGGFPGIPLAVYYPSCYFHLVDSIAKKIKVVNAVSETLELKNVHAEQANVTMLKGKYDFIVSRAVAATSGMLQWSEKLLNKNGKLILLKGGDLSEEIAEAKVHAELIELKNFFDEDYFDTKKLVIIRGKHTR